MARVKKAKKQTAIFKQSRDRPRERIIKKIEEENKDKNIATLSNN